MAVVVNSDASAFKRTANLPAYNSYSMYGWFMLTTDRNTYSGLMGITDGNGFHQLCTEVDGLALYLFRGNPAASTLLRNLSLNTWYFAALTCAGTGAGQLIAYIRELSETSWTSVSAEGISFTPNAIEWGRDGFTGEYMNGRAHAFGSSDVVYSADQLMQISQFHEPQYLGLPSLNVFYPTIEAANTSASIDRSGNARNATGTVGAIADAPPLLWKPKRRLRLVPAGGSSATNLVVADAAHAHTAENVTLTQANTLSVAAASHAHTSGSPTLTQANTLVVAGATHSHTAGAPTLTQANTLAANSASHGHSAENATLTQANTLSANGATHGHSAGSPTLTQANVLAVANALHSHAVENVTLSSGTTLSIANAVHAHLADSPSLTQANTLVIANGAHAHAAENVTLSNVVFLTVAGSSHAHAADNLALTQAHILSISDARHVTLADLVTLSEAGTLVVSDALHSHLAGSVSILLPSLGLSGVVFVVSYDRQTFTVVPSASKSYTVPK